MEFYPFHVGDWKGATDHLTLEEEAIYLRLMNLYYDTEQPLCGDVTQIARRIRCRSDDLIGLVESVLFEFFKHDGHGNWVNARCDGELAKFHDRVEKARVAGKASGRSRRNERPLNDRSAGAEPPITQDPRPSTVSDKQKRTRKKPAAFVPPDTSEVTEYFKTEKLNGDPQHFHDHFENCDWKLSNGRGSKMKNWKLAANNWSRNNAVFDPKSGGQKNGKLVLPKNQDGWQQFAEIHNLPLPRSGESYDSWRGRMQSEIDKRANH